MNLKGKWKQFDLGQLGLEFFCSVVCACGVAESTNTFKNIKKCELCVRIVPIMIIIIEII